MNYFSYKYFALIRAEKLYKPLIWLNKGMKELYNKYYKILIFIPILLFLISLGVIWNFYSNNNDFFYKDVTLTGGLSITVETDKYIDVEQLGNELKSQFPKSDIFLRKLSEFGSEKQIGIIIEASGIEEAKLKLILEKELKIKLNEDNYSIEETSGSLGESFYRQMVMAILISFILMAIVIFIIFRNLIPSLAVISAAMFDIVITLAFVDLLGIRISTAGISAFLLLIGYSVDDNILLNTRILKRKEGSVNSRLLGATKTGLTMTLTTIAALIVGYILASSVILEQMFLIMSVGLIADITSTYLTNAGIIKWYCERHEA